MSIVAAVVSFPGTTCEQDIDRAVRLMGWELRRTAHTNAVDSDADVVFLPGGFSYGDKTRPGFHAASTVAMRSVVEYARNGGLVAGICNGFQILCEAQLLPGRLVRNASDEFRCGWTHLRVENSSSPFTAGLVRGAVLRVPFANGSGRYEIPLEELEQLSASGQILFRYCTADGRLSHETNPGGSADSIAGVVNSGGNVVGLMPHPERAMEAVLGGEDGRSFFESIEQSLLRTRG